jgi:hypothetical protein
MAVMELEIQLPLFVTVASAFVIISRTTRIETPKHQKSTRRKITGQAVLFLLGE